MSFATADLCDVHGDAVDVVEPMFQSYGRVAAFCGEISTVKLFEDNSLVRDALQEPGNGRVLVIDGGGSKRCALVGDNIAASAQKQGWQGIVVYGCIRDAKIIGGMEIGVKALGTHPRRTEKKGRGDRDVVVTFGGVTFHPGHYLFSDEDGVIVSKANLLK